MHLKRARFAPNPFHDVYSHSELPQGRRSSGTRAFDEVVESRSEAGRKLKLWIYDRYLKGIMSAKDCCVLAYLHGEAGGVGCEEIAMRPDRTGGAFAKHMDEAIAKEYAAPAFQDVMVPAWDRANGARVCEAMPVRLPGSILSELSESVESVDGGDPLIGKLREAYTEHPTTKQALAQGQPWWKIRPVALYFDSVPYEKRQSFSALYLHDYRSDTRHLLWLFRWALMCSLTVSPSPGTLAPVHL